VIQPDGATHTLAVGSETLFAHDYVADVPTAALPSYLNKKRQFKVTNKTGIRLLQISNEYGHLGLNDFSADGPAELMEFFPDGLRVGASETFEFRYNEADPVPIHLRFQIAGLPGLRHQYFIELTFSGPDLSKATSVVKRIAGNSIAEIPGTAVQHSTANPIELTLPRVLVDGVRVRLHNATTYELWHTAPWAEDAHQREQRYSGDLRIAWDTGDFAVFAWDAGGLEFKVDLTLPPGVEISSGNEPQSKRIRIDTSKSKGLTAEILPAKEENLYECKIGYVRKEKVHGVYLGDGIASFNGDRIFLPVARPDNQTGAHVLMINPDDLRVTGGAEFTGKGVFSLPNEVALANEIVMASFGDNVTHLMNMLLEGPTVHLNPYTVVSAIKGHDDRGCCLIVMIDDQKSNPPAIRYHYALVRRFVGLDHNRQRVVSDSRLISLDGVKGFREQSRMPGFPAWVSPSGSPMALSPSPVSTGGERTREAAVCIAGGLFVVGGNEGTIRELALQSAGREEAIVYGREGAEIFCAHSQSDSEGLRITRVDNKAWKQTHSLSLPRGEGVADLTNDTRQRTPTDIFKSARAASMVITRDGKLLFVSHGRSIFKIDAATLTLRDDFKVDLPCRVFHTTWGKPTEFPHVLYGSPTPCTLLYAIGSSYTGDGTHAKGNDFKTELYKLAIRD
jgi:hypothetical protein